MVDAIDKFVPDMIVSSSHATEGDWQLSYSCENGQFKSEAGQMTGYNTDGNEFPVSSPNPKVYLPVGNCLLGHINGSDSMALAWMNSVGVQQMIGHIFETWFGYANGSQRGGRPIVEFFPYRLKDFALLDGGDLNPVFADDFLLVPNHGTCDPSKKYFVRFKANRMAD